MATTSILKKLNFQHIRGWSSSLIATQPVNTSGCSSISVWTRTFVVESLAARNSSNSTTRCLIPCGCFSSNILRTKPSGVSSVSYRSLSTGASEDGAWKQVYTGSLATQMKILKRFSLATSVFGICLQPILYQKLAGQSVALFLYLGSVVGFFSFATPFIIHFFAKKYVTKLHYNQQEDKYSATTLTILSTMKKTEFRVEDVVVPDVPGMFTSIMAAKKPLFLDPDQFDDLEHYGRLMGFDKPIDYMVRDIDGESDATQKEKTQ